MKMFYKIFIRNLTSDEMKLMDW